MYFCTYEPSNPTYYILLKHVFVFSSPTRLKSNGLKSVSKCPHFIHQNSQALSCWWYTYPSEKCESVGVMTFPIYGKS